jgi:hypothetical protein
LRRPRYKWKDSIKIERDYVTTVGGDWTWLRIVSNVSSVQWRAFVLAGLKRWGLHMGAVTIISKGGNQFSKRKAERQFAYKLTYNQF